MNPSDSRLANRILLAVAVVFVAALFWLMASTWLAIPVNAKLWLGLVAATVLLADRCYLWARHDKR